MVPFSFEWLMTLVIFILPAYIANSSALYFDPARHGGKSTPLDLGLNFIDGKRIFGSKGLEGMVAAILAGLLTGEIIAFLGLTPLGLSFDEWFWVSLFMSLGAHVGDKIGSFVKRRMDLKSGSRFEYFDQLGFIVFALAFAAIAAPKVSYFLGFEGYATLIVLSYVVHVLANRFAFAIGLKDVPW
ncbi:MAG: CDP-archaeol synthase [Candidatus Micrarchaeia archaeon]|jgi:CDP-2,3-bis-(O-geranylgeranyl)-sn-glycerol synthase